MDEAVKERIGLIRPFSSGRNIYKPRTVLVVSAEGCLSIPDDLDTFTEGINGVNVRFAKCLPLPAGGKHPPIDAVVFVYEVANEESLNTIKRSLPYVDMRYLVGKCFILVFSDSHFQAANTKDIEDLAASLHLPIHFVSRHKDPSNPDAKPKLRLPSEIMSIYCPPIGSDVNSLMVESAILHGEHLLNEN